VQALHYYTVAFWDLPLPGDLEAAYSTEAEGSATRRLESQPGKPGSDYDAFWRLACYLYLLGDLGLEDTLQKRLKEEAEDALFCSSVPRERDCAFL